MTDQIHQLQEAWGLLDMEQTRWQTHEQSLVGTYRVKHKSHTMEFGCMKCKFESHSLDN